MAESLAPVTLFRNIIMYRIQLAVLALILAMAIFPAVKAQDASSERTLRTWVTDAKLDDGSVARWTWTVTYSPETGQYAETAVDESGATVHQNVGNVSMMRPTEEEIEMAHAIIFADPELNELYRRASNPELEGGFVLQREEGHPCGPGSRCLQFDMFDVDTAARRVNRIRYIVVDVRHGTMVSNDFNPSTDGNATRFNGNPNPSQ